MGSPNTHHSTDAAVGLRRMTLMTISTPMSTTTATPPHHGNPPPQKSAMKTNKTRKTRNGVRAKAAISSQAASSPSRTTATLATPTPSPPPTPSSSTSDSPPSNRNRNLNRNLNRNRATPVPRTEAFRKGTEAYGSLRKPSKAENILPLPPLHPTSQQTVIPRICFSPGGSRRRPCPPHPIRVENPPDFVIAQPEAMP